MRSVLELACCISANLEIYFLTKRTDLNYHDMLPSIYGRYAKDSDHSWVEGFSYRLRCKSCKWVSRHMNSRPKRCPIKGCGEGSAITSIGIIMRDDVDIPYHGICERHYDLYNGKGRLDELGKHWEVEGF